MTKALSHQSDHLPYLDVLRIIGTIAVVLIHVCSPLVVAYGTVSAASWWTGHVLDSLSRWAVPVFVMISGAVLLDSKKTSTAVLSQEELTHFFTKRFWRLAVPLFVWTLFFAWYYHVFRGDPLSLDFSLRRIVFDQPYEHLYFLWLLLELAVITPWLKQLIKEIPFSSTVFLAGLFLGISVFWTQLRLLFPFFIPYIGYYLMGYVLKDVALKKSLRNLVSVVTVASAVSIVFGTWLAFTDRVQLDHPLVLYEYTTVFVVVMSLGVFVLVRQICTRSGVREVLFKHSVPLRLLSSLTFGVYLVHPVVIDVLHHGAGISVMAGRNTFLRIVLVMSATLLLSGLLSYGIELVTRRMRRFFTGTRYVLKDPHAQFPSSHKR